MIPKIIWQTHEWELGDLPEVYKHSMIKKSMNSWKDMNPTWEYRYISARERLEHIREYGGKELLKYYIDSSRVNQSDLWRYLIMYKFGGVYSDMDSLCIMPLDTMLDLYYNNEDVILPAPMRGLADPILNGSMAAVPESAFFRTLLENILAKYRKLPIERPNTTCGSSCCFNDPNGCNGRNDYALGYEFFSRHAMKNLKYVSTSFDAALHC